MPGDPLAEWLAALGTLTAGAMTATDARDKIGAYAAMLRDDFPPACFTKASLAAVARACKFFPAYGELCDALTAWSEASGTHRQAPPLARRSGPREEQTAIGDSWDRFIGQRLTDGVERGKLLSMLRAHCPPGQVAAIMARHFAAEMEAADAHTAAVNRDKARAAERVAAAIGDALRAPPLHPDQPQNQPTPPPPEAPPLHIEERPLASRHLDAARAKAAAALGRQPLAPIKRQAEPAERPSAAPTGQTEDYEWA